MLNVLYVSLGVLIALALAGTLIYWYIQDITQKKHAVLRNFPIIGHLRYFFENLGEYLAVLLPRRPRGDALQPRHARLGLSAGQERGRHPRLRLHLQHPRGRALIFVNAPFPVLEEEREPTPPLIIGDGHCDKPFRRAFTDQRFRHELRRHLEARRAGISRARAAKGRLLDGYRRGGLAHHLEGGCDLIFQIGTAKYGVRDDQGRLSPEKLREVAAHDTVRAFRDQALAGRQTGQGRRPPRRQGDRRKSRASAASRWGRIRCRRTATATSQHDRAARHGRARLATITGKPVGIKTAIGGWQFMNELAEEVESARSARGADFPRHRRRRGRQRRGTAGAGRPHGALHRRGAAAGGRLLIESGLRQRVRLIAADKLLTPARVAWALATGADFVNTARGFVCSRSAASRPCAATATPADRHHDAQPCACSGLDRRR